MRQGCRAASWCGVPEPQGCLVGQPCVLLSLPFCSRLRFNSFFCLYLPLFSVLFFFIIILWSLDHSVNILSANEIKGQQLLDLSKN
jgi:hypothetical protein